MDGTPGSSATRAAPYSLARRRIVRGLAVTALGGTLLSRGAVLGADRAGTASCGGNAGVEMVRMWSLGGFPVPPTRALPGPTWVLYAHPTVPQISFLYPPDWTATTLFDPVWAGVRLESPDRQAALEGASAALPVIGLTARQAAAHGLERLLTAASVVTTLCVDDLPSPAGPAAGLAMSFAAVAAGVATSRGAGDGGSVADRDVRALPGAVGAGRDLHRDRPSGRVADPLPDQCLRPRWWQGDDADVRVIAEAASG